MDQELHDWWGTVRYPGSRRPWGLEGQKDLGVVQCVCSGCGWLWDNSPPRGRKDQAREACAVA